MKTFAFTSNGAWAAVIIASLMMGGLAVSASAHGQQVSNPLRRDGYSPEPATGVSSAPMSSTAPANVPVKVPVMRAEYRPIAADRVVPSGRTVGFVPKHERVATIRRVQAVQGESSRLVPRPAAPIPADSPMLDSQELELLPGERLVEGPVYQGNAGETYPDEMYSSEGDFESALRGMPAEHGCCDGGGCSDCCQPCSPISFHNLELFAGAQGFTGPLNRGQTGSFGFHYGANWGTPLLFPGLGGQLGVRVTHSNYSGAEFTDDSRSQGFLTAGLFHRVDWGLQWGLAVDYLRDDWYLELDLAQIRGELSWVFPNCHELGIWFTTSTRSSSSQTVVFTDINTRQTLTETYGSKDLFAFFYRRRLGHTGGNYRLFAGVSGDSDALLGGDINVPLSDRVSLRSEFTYLAPDNQTERLDHRDEAWNVSLGLAWKLGPPSMGRWSYYRPLFDVADNGSFLINRP